MMTALAEIDALLARMDAEQKEISQRQELLARQTEILREARILLAATLPGSSKVERLPAKEDVARSNPVPATRKPEVDVAVTRSRVGPVTLQQRTIKKRDAPICPDCHAHPRSHLHKTSCLTKKQSSSFTPSNEVAKQEPSDTNEPVCVHHWRVDSPIDGRAASKCVKCGNIKVFMGSWDGYGGDGSPVGVKDMVKV